MASGPRRILLFGLSANPPTGEGGHRGLVRWVATRPAHPELGGPIEAVWVLPVARHAFAEKANLADFEHRLAMCRLAFEDLPGGVPVEVLDVEREVARARAGRPVGTIDVIEALEARHPEVRFGLLLGADTARDLVRGRWRRADELRARIPLVVVGRPGDAGLEGDLAVAPDAPAPSAVSSTEARRATGDRLRALVAPAVADYIERHGLYAAGRSGGPPDPGAAPRDGSPEVG